MSDWQQDERQDRYFPVSVSVALGPFLIILGVCVKWAIFPPVVDSLVSQQDNVFQQSNVDNNFKDSHPQKLHRNLHHQVHSYLTLSPNNTDTWEAWLEPTEQQPLFMKFTFFNVDNAEQIISNNAKPRVSEKGAFAYREVKWSKNIKSPHVNARWKSKLQVRRKEHVRPLLDEISYGR